MGVIIRLPFFLVGVLVWTMMGGFISFLNLVTLPVFAMASAILPSIFKTSAKDILTLGTLRRGYRNLAYFLKYGY